MTEARLDEIRAVISEYHDSKRLPHVLGVERETVSLCRIMGISESDTLSLRFAALLHDSTKNRSAEWHFEYLKKNGYTVSPDTVKSHKTLHQLSGAYFARETYPDDIDDVAFSAIMRHTTGENMSQTDEILFLADYIEETRTFGDCVALRKYFYVHIETNSDRRVVMNKTLLKAFDMTISDLIANRKYIHSGTVCARNRYLEMIKE